jgi:5-methylthioadenosine/S-adenosylhomocysteine deaminase
MKLLIKDGHLVSGERADVLVDNGEIVAVGSVPAVDTAEVIDAAGLVVAPGFVDGHRHVWQAPLRGIGADMTLPDFFEAVAGPGRDGRPGGRALNAYGPSDIHLATLLGAAEALNAGITTVFDWSNTTRTPQHTDAVLDAFTTAGIRAVVAHANPDDERDVRRLAALRGRVTGALAITGTEYGPWDDGVRQIELGRQLGLVVSMHANGGPGSPLRRMYEAGLLGPHLQLVHLNNMTDDDAKLLVDNGVGVTVTPVVEAMLGYGASPFSRFADAGGRAGLGTDVVVNAPPDLFEPIRDTLRSQRAHTGTTYPAGSIFAAATIDSAHTVGLGDVVGTVTPGKRADLVLFDGLTHLLGTGDLTGAVVATLGPADVHTVLVDGRIVKRDGRLAGLDLRQLRRSAAELVRRVT